MKKKIIALSSVFLALCFSAILYTNINSDSIARLYRSVIEVAVDSTEDITVQKRDLSNFNSIEIDGVFEVILVKSSKEEVEIESTPNMAGYIITEVRHNSLILDIKDKRKSRKYKIRGKVKLTVYYKDINRIVHNGVGEVSTQNVLEADDLHIELNGVGASAWILEVNNLNIRSSGVGNSKFEGKAKKVDLVSHGVGNINAYDLESGKLHLKSLGVGNIKINVSDELSINSSGVGNVKYKGTPKILDLSVTSVGKVKKVE